MQAESTGLEQLLADYQALASAKRQAALQSQPHSTTNLIQQITVSAEQYDIVFSEIATLSERRLSLSLKNAAFDKIVRWLYDLKLAHAVNVGTLSIKRLKEPGHVDVSVVLYR